MNFFFENLSLVPETSAAKEHFKLVFGSGTSDLAKIRPLKIWTSWISPWVPPYGILPPWAPFSTPELLDAPIWGLTERTRQACREPSRPRPFLLACASGPWMPLFEVEMERKSST